MRLTLKEVESIKKNLLSYSSEGEIYLHGSRLDDNKKGGDIDLFFILPDEDYEKVLKNKFTITAEVSLALNEQKVDIVYLSRTLSQRDSFFINSVKSLI
jgi:predicted nucleotidyltransferase